MSLLQKHLKDVKYIVNQFDINEENLKSLKKFSKYFYLISKRIVVEKNVKPEKKEMTEYFVTNIVLNTRNKKQKLENLNLRRKLEAL